MITVIIIVLVVLYFVKNIISDLSPKVDPLKQPLDDPTVVEGHFTPKTLLKYNGTDNPRIFMAVRGKVYDVSQGASFYGPGGPYENFAGRDASRGLAKNSFDIAMLTDIDKPLDTLTDLTKEELESLDNWEEHFEMKYKVVGTLNEN